MRSIDSVIRLISSDLDATDARIVAVSRSEIVVLLNYIMALDEQDESPATAHPAVAPKLLCFLLGWLGMPFTIAALAIGLRGWMG